MGMVQFGNTWWGEKWLEALDTLDYSNRLPRGVRYARNGSVRSVSISGNLIEARVEGRRPTPYKLSMRLEKFTKEQKKEIISRISKNPYYLSQLEGHQLPQEILGELEALNIRLLPDSWKAMGMKCSCPDWAVPCKHLAAVVYLIANEIDKNPYLIFSLHGFDLQKELKLEHMAQSLEPILRLEELYSKTQESYEYDRQRLEALDLNAVPELRASLVKLLVPNPLFYPEGDFKKILEDRYKRAAKHAVKVIERTPLIESEGQKGTCSVSLSLDTTRGLLTGAVSAESFTHPLSFDLGLMEELCEYLLGLSIHDLHSLSEPIGFLAILLSFSLKLLERGAYLPELIQLKEHRFSIRWIPALFNTELKRIFDTLVDALPTSLIKVQGATLSKREHVLFVISQFIYHVIALSAPKQGSLGQDQMIELFFSGKPYMAKSFEQKENSRSIDLWLGRFLIHPSDCVPVISIEETEDQESFTVDLLVEERANRERYSLREFFASSHPATLDLLRDCYLLSAHLPEIDQVLKEQSKISVDAHTFVSNWFEAQPVLRTLEIQTIIPKSLERLLRPNLTLSLRMKSSTDTNIVSYLDLQSLVEFDWQILIGENPVEVNEFLKRVQEESGLIRFHDSYVLVDAKQVARMKREMEKEISVRPIELLAMSLGHEHQGMRVNLSRELQGTMANLLKIRKTSVPSGLDASLREYQKQGFDWLYHNYRIGFGSLLADDMGLGKTLQVITFLVKLQETGALGKKGALIIAPASVLLNWQREIIRFAPSLRSRIYHGVDRDAEVILDPKVEILITTYALARSDAALLKKRSWNTLVIDEAQFIKNSESNQAKAIKSLRADYRIALTGTPVENRLLDFWSISDYTVKGLLGTKKSFLKAFAIPIEKFNDTERLELFKRITAPFMIRRVKTDTEVISDLPEKVEQQRWAPLSEEQVILYTSLTRTIEEDLSGTDGIRRKGAVFKLITGLKQICDHPALFLKDGKGASERSGKAGLLLELLDLIDQRGEKVLIFTQFKQMGSLIQQLLEQERGQIPLFFHGGLSQSKRNEIVDSFNGQEQQRVLIISLKAGGTGLNLTAANNVIHYDMWWNPAVEAQATDRVYRIGQRRGVNVYRLITKGTFEQRINQMLIDKRELANMAVNQGEGWIGELSDADLKELLELSSEENERI